MPRKAYRAGRGGRHLRAGDFAAWKTKPAWGIVSSEDHTINPEVERFGYTRAGLRGIVDASCTPPRDAEPPDRRTGDTKRAG